MTENGAYQAGANRRVADDRHPLRPRWRLRLAHLIYPWWTDYEVDAIKWRAHVKRREMGFVRCVDVHAFDEPPCTADDCPCSTARQSDSTGHLRSTDAAYWDECGDCGHYRSEHAAPPDPVCGCDVLGLGEWYVCPCPAFADARQSDSTGQERPPTGGSAAPSTRQRSLIATRDATA